MSFCLFACLRLCLVVWSLTSLPKNLSATATYVSMPKNTLKVASNEEAAWASRVSNEDEGEHEGGLVDTAAVTYDSAALNKK